MIKAERESFVIQSKLIEEERDNLSRFFEVNAMMTCDNDCQPLITSISLGSISCHHIAIRKVALTNQTPINCKVFLRGKTINFEDATFPLSDVSQRSHLTSTLPFSLPKTRAISRKSGVSTKQFLSTTKSVNVSKKSSSLLAEYFNFNSENHWVLDPSSPKFSNISDQISTWLSQQFSENVVFFLPINFDGTVISQNNPLYFKSFESREFLLLSSSCFPGFYQEELTVCNTENYAEIFNFDVSFSTHNSPIFIQKRTPNLYHVNSMSCLLQLYPVLSGSEKISREFYVENPSFVDVDVTLSIESDDELIHFAVNTTSFSLKSHSVGKFDLFFNPPQFATLCKNTLSVLCYPSDSTNFKFSTIEPIKIDLVVESVKPELDIDHVEDNFHYILNSDGVWNPARHSLLIRNPLLSTINFNAIIKYPFKFDGSDQNSMEVCLKSNETLSLPIIFDLDPSEILNFVHNPVIERSVDFTFNSNENSIISSKLVAVVDYPLLKSEDDELFIGKTNRGIEIVKKFKIFNFGLSPAIWSCFSDSSVFNISETFGVLSAKKSFQSGLSNYHYLSISFLPKDFGSFEDKFEFSVVSGNSFNLTVKGICEVEELS
ncbi:hypothetical protein GEMRC1_003322 [Eukaryota sp. GEM-RC1]